MQFKPGCDQSGLKFSEIEPFSGLVMKLCDGIPGLHLLGAVKNTPPPEREHLIDRTTKCVQLERQPSPLRCTTVRVEVGQKDASRLQGTMGLLHQAIRSIQVMEHGRCGNQSQCRIGERETLCISQDGEKTLATNGSALGQDKHPIPSEAARKTAVDLVRELYAKE